MTKFQKHYGPAIAFAGLLMLVAVSTVASAAAIPLIGEVESWKTVEFWALIIGVLALVGAIGAGRGMVSKIPFVGGFIAAGGAVLGVIALVVAGAMAPGGLGQDDAVSTPNTQSFIAGSLASSGGAYSAALYEPVSDVTFYFADAALPATQVNPAVTLYKAGVSEKAATQGTATALYSGTASSGTLNFAAISVQDHGCLFDVHADASGFYEETIKNVNLCRAVNANGLNEVSIPTIYMHDIGTLSLSLTDTSFTCSAGSTCTYSLVIRNSEADSLVRMGAVKFSTATNATLDAVVSGDCELVEVSSTQYIAFDNELGSLESETCNVSITRTASSADGTWAWTYDDLFQWQDATAWNTNSNTRGASATSATTVTFA